MFTYVHLKQEAQLLVWSC